MLLQPQKKLDRINGEGLQHDSRLNAQGTFSGKFCAGNWVALSLVMGITMGMRNSMKNLIIIGASGFGREVAWLVERINQVQNTWKLLGFLDDNPALKDSFVNGYPVLGSVDRASEYKDCCFVCAIGASKVRKKIIQSLPESTEYATLIDPSAEMSAFVSVGKGSIICAHNLLTVNISIGNHVIINLDCTVGHDAVLGDFTTLYPSVNVSGATTTGSCVELGTGVQIIQGKTIGENTILGAGAVVVKDIPPNCTAVGSPAKPIKFFE